MPRRKRSLRSANADNSTINSYKFQCLSHSTKRRQKWNNENLTQTSQQTASTRSTQEKPPQQQVRSSPSSMLAVSTRFRKKAPSIQKQANSAQQRSSTTIRKETFLTDFRMHGPILKTLLTETMNWIALEKSPIPQTTKRTTHLTSRD